jgi:diguanylate cyclase (GGDEF)-like protein
MRISTKLVAVVLSVFVIVSAVAAFAVERFRDVAHVSVATEARNVATTMATMTAYEVSDGSIEERQARFQRITEFIGVRQKRDLEIIDRNLVIVADVDTDDVGKAVKAGPRRESIAATLRDGESRVIIEAAPETPGGLLRQVVVPVYDPGQKIIAALVFEYTPLYDDLLARARDSLLLIEIAALLGLVLASLCAGWISRSISVPLRQLTDAAHQLAQGHRKVTVSTNSKDEVGALAKVFNTMSIVLLASEENLSRQAQTDMLTGLANRNLLMERLNKAMADARRNGDWIVVAFIDLDGFKAVNDKLGHETGDLLLKCVAERLRACVRSSDTVARLGGDEFVLLLPNERGNGILGAETHIAEQMLKLVVQISAPMKLAGNDVQVSCSIGVATFPQDGNDVDALIKHADTAMYRAKELGKNQYQFFTSELQMRANEQLALREDLRHALEHDEFEVHYQPQVNLRSGKVVGVEALLRWRHPTLGLVGPAHFIAFAEETGLIIPIGEWVLKRACVQNKQWQDAGLPAVPVAVNVSAKQCAHPDLESIVRRALEESGLSPHCLELELTESVSMADPERSVPMMERMKEIGVLLSIDDFGTGYSNMSYLRRFPIDRLKLDISFVREITTDPSSLAITDAIITMAHSLHLEVVAEGVETEGQLTLLASRNCDIMQGYFFSKPLPPADIEQLLREKHGLPAALTRRGAGAPMVLVLDDDTLFLEYLSLVLSNEGYEVHATADPLHAFELLACHEFAVVLCDQRMPAMDGIEFLSRVKGMYPDAVRIVHSAYDDSLVTREAINRGGVYKFVDKSADYGELKNVVKDAFEMYLNQRLPRVA